MHYRNLEILMDEWLPPNPGIRSCCPESLFGYLDPVALSPVMKVYKIERIPLFILARYF